MDRMGKDRMKIVRKKQRRGKSRRRYIERVQRERMREIKFVSESLMFKLVCKLTP